MRKIGGVNMDTVARLSGNITKDKKAQRYCTVYESLEQSLKEVKLIKEGKIKPQSWRKMIEELKQDEE